MNYFLVDYENVKTAGLSGISRLTEEDVVIIFYSDNANTITFDLHWRLSRTRAQVRFQKVAAGLKNALDFQMVSYLGYAIHENLGRDIVYYLVTRDQGFSVLPLYWIKQKVDVRMTPNLGQPFPAVKPMLSGILSEVPDSFPPLVSLSTEPEEASVIGDDLEERLLTLLPNKNQVFTVAEIIRHCQTKQDIHRELGKAFRPGPKDKTVGVIYKAIKPLITERFRAADAKKTSGAKETKKAKEAKESKAAKEAKEPKAAKEAKEAEEAKERQAADAVPPPDTEEPKTADTAPPDTEIIPEDVSETITETIPKTEPLEKRLETLLPGETRLAQIAEIIRRYDTRAEIHIALSKALQTEEGQAPPGEVYAAIAPLLSDKL